MVEVGEPDYPTRYRLDGTEWLFYGGTDRIVVTREDGGDKKVVPRSELPDGDWKRLESEPEF